MLLKLAENNPNNAAWWVIPLKKHMFGKFKGINEQQNLWNETDVQK